MLPYVLLSDSLAIAVLQAGNLLSFEFEQLNVLSYQQQRYSVTYDDRLIFNFFHIGLIFLSSLNSSMIFLKSLVFNEH